MKKAKVIRDKDGQLRIQMPGDDRSEYHKEYYQQHKEEYKQYYVSKKHWVEWLELKKVLTSLKKQIGTNNFDLIMSEIEKLKTN